jgi:hypothetical protein
MMNRRIAIGLSVAAMLALAFVGDRPPEPRRYEEVEAGLDAFFAFSDMLLVAHEVSEHPLLDAYGYAEAEEPQEPPKPEAKWGRAEISVYCPKTHHGQKMANGKRYDHYRGMIAAVKRKPKANGKGYDPVIPFGTKIELEHKGRKIIVTVSDHGSYKTPNDWFDLSGEAWQRLTNNAKPDRIHGVKWRVVK